MSATTATTAPDPDAPDPDATEHHEHAGPTILQQLRLPVLSLFLSLFIGWLLVWVTAPSEGPGGALGVIAELFNSSLGGWGPISETLVNTVPLLLAGLSVALAFQAGLFNIGAFGQIVAGTVVAGWVGFTFDLPTIIHLPLAVLGGAIGGGVWGFLVGLLKARTGAHEVITTIMMNFIALRLADYALTLDAFQKEGRNDAISRTVAETAQLPQFFGQRVNPSVLIALGAVVAVWFLLDRTTLGFRIRTVGQNPNAATYAGMSVGATWMLAMALAGALSGLAGASNVLGITREFSGSFPNIGFDAIALALLGRTRPWGVAAAALLFGALRAGGVGMQTATQTSIDIIVVIQGLIIAFVAAPIMVRWVFRLKDTGDEGVSFTTGGWA